MRTQGMDHEQREDFAAFYASARDGCLRAVCAVVGDPVLAEELAAEAFSKAFAHWHKVQRHPAPQAWVIRVALRTHVSWWRKRRREVAWPAAGPAHEWAAHDAPSFDDELLAALRALPRRQREVFALRVLLDLDTNYTAQVLSIAPGTVTVHLSRATAALRAALTPDPDQERVSP